MDEYALRYAGGEVAGHPPVPSYVPPWVDEPVLHLRGTIEGTALEDLGTMLDEAMTGSTGRVRLDLSAVDGWSLLAQAMVLNTARLLASRGRRLVLLNPSQALRDRSRILQVFERVPTELVD